LLLEHILLKDFMLIQGVFNFARYGKYYILKS
jgi:hypothetical protein